MIVGGFVKDLERINDDLAKVVFRAPDGATLRNLQDIVDYCGKKETCKCGLPNVINVNEFSFGDVKFEKISLKLKRDGGKWSNITPGKKRKAESDERVSKKAKSDKDELNLSKANQSSTEQMCLPTDSKSEEDEFEFEIIDSLDEDSERSDMRGSTPELVQNERHLIFVQFKQKYQKHLETSVDEIDLQETDEDNNHIEKLRTDTRPSRKVDKKNHQFEIGDLIWGRFANCAAWPGVIVDPSRVQKDDSQKPAKLQPGRHWVMWFGEKSLTQVSTGSLKSMEDGLSQPAPVNPRKTSKRNSEKLERAIEEALLEYSRRENRSKLRKRAKY